MYPQLVAAGRRGFEGCGSSTPPCRPAQNSAFAAALWALIMISLLIVDLVVASAVPQLVRHAVLTRAAEASVWLRFLSVACALESLCLDYEGRAFTIGRNSDVDSQISGDRQEGPSASLSRKGAVSSAIAVLRQLSVRNVQLVAVDPSGGDAAVPHPLPFPFLNGPSVLCLTELDLHAVRGLEKFDFWEQISRCSRLQAISMREIDLGVGARAILQMLPTACLISPPAPFFFD